MDRSREDLNRIWDRFEMHSGSKSLYPVKTERTQKNIFIKHIKEGKAIDLGRRWQRYTAILVRQRQAVGTERCGGAGLVNSCASAAYRPRLEAGVRGTAYCRKGRRAGHGLLPEGQTCGHGLLQGG
ncbi:BQ5605_C030g10880 [Microbotryum silenes-dioicae]|uniref:BQ5605_C030g10871 protein n=1 Tax=Microbotryum silenes-dioicae TaxID=796604 RepID=A0A2X0PCI0_9BASI|nr:BQ5605_C030g10871 [Microbotryum silenes-dioicae]SGZ09531.1 BQ5605_C030g10880 [Microbotryum silenes-dioicae]